MQSEDLPSVNEGQIDHLRLDILPCNIGIITTLFNCFSRSSLLSKSFIAMRTLTISFNFPKICFIMKVHEKQYFIFLSWEVTCIVITGSNKFWRNLLKSDFQNLFDVGTLFPEIYIVSRSHKYCLCPWYRYTHHHPSAGPYTSAQKFF